jgi:hypothetical protein
VNALKGGPMPSNPSLCPSSGMAQLPDRAVIHMRYNTNTRLVRARLVLRKKEDIATTGRHGTCARGAAGFHQPITIGSRIDARPLTLALPVERVIGYDLE